MGTTTLKYQHVIVMLILYKKLNKRKLCLPTTTSRFVQKHSTNLTYAVARLASFTGLLTSNDHVVMSMKDRAHLQTHKFQVNIILSPEQRYSISRIMYVRCRLTALTKVKFIYYL